MAYAQLFGMEPDEFASCGGDAEAPKVYCTPVCTSRVKHQQIWMLMLSTPRPVRPPPELYSASSKSCKSGLTTKQNKIY